jgi:hypothetical protein
MKILKQIIPIYIILTLFLISCKNDETVKTEPKPTNYAIIIDLSDRILIPEQLDKDFYLIEKCFEKFEQKARQNLVLISKDRFSVKIIPQKGSPLNIDHFQDLLQLNLDEIPVKDKNKCLLNLSKSLHGVLEKLKKDAIFDTRSTAYFGVDIWAYLHDNGLEISKPKYENTVLVLTDGYFDFENQAHVIKDKNKYTSTRFLNELIGPNWLKSATENGYGLMPIKLEKQTKWIVAGISGKKANDILQTEKITYFWKKWLTESGVESIPTCILNGSKTAMSSELFQLIK